MSRRAAAFVALVLVWFAAASPDTGHGEEASCQASGAPDDCTSTTHNRREMESDDAALLQLDRVKKTAMAQRSQVLADDKSEELEAEIAEIRSRDKTLQEQLDTLKEQLEDKTDLTPETAFVEDARKGYSGRLYLLHAKKGYTGTLLEDICANLPGFAQCEVRSKNKNFDAVLPFVVVTASEEEHSSIMGAHPDIDFSEPDAAISVGPDELDDKDVTPTKISWGLDRIDSRGISSDVDGGFHTGLTPGRGSHVYVVDSGIVQHEDFGYRMVPTIDVDMEPQGVPKQCGINGLRDTGLHSAECATDRSSHGTHTAATIGGTTYGVAKKTMLHAVKVTTNRRFMRASGLAAALYWIACCGERPAVASINIESEWTQTESYRRAVEALDAAGVTVVVPAGNRKRGGPDDACNDFLKFDKGITVGATGKTSVNYHYHADFFSDFSNYGSCIDILAPGVDIVTASGRDRTRAAQASGTSLAGAHAAGAAACILGTGEMSAPSEVKAKILDDGKATNRRRREPKLNVRRRQPTHRALEGSADKVVYVGGGTDQIHRRRGPNTRRRRTVTDDDGASREAEENQKEDEETPTTSLSGIPIYGPAQEAGLWIINFVLPPEGFEFYPSSYSRTLAVDYCKDLSGNAVCIFKGRPREGGIPFVVLQATKAELETILARQPPCTACPLQNTPAKVEFVEADREISSILEVEEAVEPDEPKGSAHAVGRRRRGLSWGLDRVDSQYVLDGAYMVPRSGGYKDFGEGINKTQHVYVLDTGIRTTHRDFGGRALPALDISSGCLRECKGDTSCAADTNGHGTHVAAVVAGESYGVAKSAIIHAVKVIGDDGKGRLSSIIAALDWIGRKGEEHPTALMNFEGVGKSKSMQRTTNFANLMGYVTLVVGSGNSGTDACAKFPANMKTIGGKVGAGTISVAATTMMDKLAGYSNYGTCVDYLAPGSAILTASHTSDDESVHVSGTSLAAAHVAGAAALLKGSEKAEGYPSRVNIFLYLGSYYESQIDIKEGSEQASTHNRLLYVREAAVSPVLPPKAATCYGCSYTLSGCPCMKEWKYQYGGKTHTCDNYCCDPYGDKSAPQGYCMTQNKCTVRVRGEAPVRQLTDKCDTVPGRRLTGGWLVKPHVYEPDPTPRPTPAPEPEDECIVATTATPTSAPVGPTPAPAGPSDAPDRPTPGPVGPAPAPAGPTGVPAGPAADLTGTPSPEIVVSEIQRDLNCLTKRLAGQPCP